MTEELKQVSDQLSVGIRLLAIMVSAHETSFRAKCSALARAGMKANEIAETLGTTAGTVRVELSRERKKPSRGQK
jgi:hypothetical protein